jgi:hypothetical protein
MRLGCTPSATGGRTTSRGMRKHIGTGEGNRIPLLSPHPSIKHPRHGEKGRGHNKRGSKDARKEEN